MAPASTLQSTKVKPTNSICGGIRLRGVFASGSVDEPLVSVITAVFNCESHLAGCLESVLQQDYRNIEHIIMDGGSRDGTVDVLRAYEDRIALWRSESDDGIYDAWNKGLREARGEWICFLGADDELLPGAINAYMDLASHHPEAEYLSSTVRWVHPSGYVNSGHGRPWDWKLFSKRMCVAHPGSMHRRRLFDRLGEFDTRYRTAADYELLLRARKELRTAFMRRVTAVMRAGGVSDQASAFQEAERAKVTSGGRNRLLARLELWGDQARFRLLPLYRKIQFSRKPTEEPR